jgi:hypothetical protein
MKRSNSEQGRINRKKGQTFEQDTRHDLEAKGWIVCKWQNIVKDGKLIHAPHRYMPFKKMMLPGSGFPDFLVFKRENGQVIVEGVEAKKAKYLDQKEKDMCQWYYDNNIFTKITVAYKKKGKLEYIGVPNGKQKEDQTEPAI